LWNLGRFARTGRRLQYKAREGLERFDDSPLELVYRKMGLHDRGINEEKPENSRSSGIVE
jgi:hypothetical protein